MQVDNFRALSKDELIALIEELGWMFFIKQKHVISAKIKVLEARETVLHKQWMDFEMPDFWKNDEQLIKYFQAKKSREAIWEKYESISRKIDKLYKQLKSARV